MPTPPKDSIGRPSITFHLKEAEIAAVDKEIAEYLKAAPAAKLSRSAWVEFVVREYLKKRAQEGDAKATPAKKS